MSARGQDGFSGRDRRRVLDTCVHAAISELRVNPGRYANVAIRVNILDDGTDLATEGIANVPPQAVIDCPPVAANGSWSSKSGCTHSAM